MAGPAFRAAAVRVRVPATSANLGPGFDTLGLALGLYDDVVVRVADSGLNVDIAGEGAEALPRDESHLVVRAMRTAFELLGGQPRGLEVVCANRIPHGRGLGSSAAAICAGITAARAVSIGGGERLDDAGLLDLAAELEGHPDNVAACLLGGFTLAWSDEPAPVAVPRDHLASGPPADPADPADPGGAPAAAPAAGTGGGGGGEPDGGGIPAAAEGLAGGPATVRAIRIEPAGSVVPVIFVPGRPMPTSEARGLLPRTVPHIDAAHNAGRAALLVEALTNRPELLFAATEDRIHQNYRASAMPESTALVARLRAGGVPAVISGAGPTVLAFAEDGAAEKVARSAGPGWAANRLALDREGASVLPLA